MKKNTIIFKKLADELDSTALIAFTNKDISINESFIALDKIEKQTLEKVHSDKHSDLEVRRRIAERKFSIAEQKSSSFEDIEKAFHNLKILGFDSLESRSTFEVIFSLACKKYECLDKALNILHSLLEDVILERKASNNINYLDIEQNRIERIYRTVKARIEDVEA